jgi:outer membrane protein insertion porin family
MVLRVLIFLASVSLASAQIILSDIEFQGNTVYERSELLEIMNSTEGDELKAYFAYSDQRALANLYKYNGFIDVEITFQIVNVTTDGQKRKLVFTILENKQSVFGHLHFSGNTSISTDKFKDGYTGESGKAFQEVLLFDLKQKIEQMYQEIGHLLISVDVQRKPRSTDRYTIDIDIVIQENQQFYFRNLFISSGIDTVSLVTNLSIVEDEIPFVRGDVYNALMESNIQKNLYELDIFQSVNIRKVFIQASDSTLADSLDLNIELIEKRNYFSLSGAISTTANEEYVKQTESDNVLKQLNYEISADIGKRNLKGTGTDVGMLVNPTWYFDENNDFRNFSTRFKLYTRIINFPIQHFHSTIDFTELLVRPQLGNLERFQVNYMTRKRIDVRSFFDFNFIYDRNTVASELNDDQLRRLGFNDYNIFSFGTRYSIDERSSNLMPKNGASYLGYAKFSTASALTGTNDDSQYYTLNFEWRRYQPFIAPRNITLATNLRIASIIVQSDVQSIDVIPKTDRLYVGNSLRGYNSTKFGLLEQVIFPQLDADSIQYEPVGGRLMFVANFELRFDFYKVLDNLYFQTFLDIGGLWQKPEEVSLETLRYSAGFGFTYNFGVILLRIDYGFKIDPKSDLSVRNAQYPDRIPSESTGRFSFGLSYHF